MSNLISKLFNSLENPKVFITSSTTILGLVVFSLLQPELADTTFGSVQAAFVDNLSWFYVLTVAIVLVCVCYLSLSRFASIRLGPDHAAPDYGYLTWLSMLFAAGMGIGLMFFGVAEPLMHYLAPPTAQEQSIEAMREAMKTTFFHWGFHAWAIYSSVALVLAYFGFRQNLPLTLRSALYPIIGNKIYGWQGHSVDTFAVVSTIFGVATSLGVGVTQINSGLFYLFELPVTASNQVILITAVTLLAIVSVASGLDRGIKILSEINMVLAIALLGFILILGDTVFLLSAYVQNIGAYLADIVRTTFNLFAYQKTDWIGGWTIFYWGWWIAWAPFVGLFIARISRGRTIREFIMGVLMVPTAFTLLWMTVFGNSAIDLVAQGGAEALASQVEADASVALFVFLEQFPLVDLISGLALVMVVIFFITSCDSGALVVNMLCSNGEDKTPLWQRIYWAGLVGVVASVLLLAGGLNALQTMTITAALPFSVALLGALLGLYRALQVEGYKRESLNVAAVPNPVVQVESSWQERLENIVDYPNKSKVDRFIISTVQPALETVSKEFAKHEITAEVTRYRKSLVLRVSHSGEHDFVYGVHRRKHIQPTDFNQSDDDDDELSYYRAEVHLSEGGQDYDVMGWSKEALINDVIDQYHKHQHFLHLLR